MFDVRNDAEVSNITSISKFLFSRTCFGLFQYYIFIVSYIKKYNFSFVKNVTMRTDGIGIVKQQRNIPFLTSPPGFVMSLHLTLKR